MFDGQSRPVKCLQNGAESTKVFFFSDVARLSGKQGNNLLIRATYNHRHDYTSCVLVRTRKFWKSHLGAKEDFFLCPLLKFSNRDQGFTPTTTHVLQERTGGVYDWSVIASKWRIQ